MKQLLKQILILILFLSAPIIFFRKILLTRGIIIGYDWGLPLTIIQINKVFSDSLSTWTDQGFFLGARSSFFTAVPYHALIKFMSNFGIDGQIYTKLILLFLFTFAGFTMYKLARFFKLEQFPSIFAGLIYITTPIFFNYSIMGWIFVLFSLGLLPLATKYFIQSVEERSLKYVMLTSILYALSIIQSQSLIWFMIVFIMLSFYLIKDKQSLFFYIRSMFFIIVTLFLLNAYWILGLLIAPDTQTFGSDIINSTVSLGSLFHLRPVNIIRLWGGLANFQYEHFTNDTPHLLTLSFLLPMLAILPLLLKIKQRLIISLWLIALVPLIMRFLNNYRDLLLNIPFSNGIRDFARFTTLSTFAYPILAAILINYLIIKRNKFLILIIATLWFFSIYPWRISDISNWKIEDGCAGRLRTKVFPKEYIELEKNLSNKKLDQKSFYLPTGGIVDFNDDYKFHSICNETWDIFAGFSPIPGALSLTDRKRGYLTEYIDNIKNNLDRKRLIDLLSLTNIKYIIIRKNLLKPEEKHYLKNIESLTENNILSKYLENTKLVVYIVNDYLPHFFIADKSTVSDDKVNNLIEIIKDMKSTNSKAVFFKQQNPHNNIIKILENNNNYDNILSSIEFKKITSYKYRVLIHKVKNGFPLIFNEAFHDRWKAYVVKTNSLQSIKQTDIKFDNYMIANGNETDQASREEVKAFMGQGLISTIGGDKNIDFISKNFKGTIQNDNLSNGKFYDTLLSNNLVTIPDAYHLMANGYANAWYINPDKLCIKNQCSINADGTYNIELIVDFEPQRILLLSSFISGFTLLFCLGYIILVSLINRKSKYIINNQNSVK